jgi:tetratricopeptide (TPR) repeat protein
MTPPEMLRQHLLTGLICTALLIIQLVVLSDAQAAGKSSSYVIVLASAPGTNLKWQPKTSPLLEGRTVYVTQTTVKGKPYERLNMGFFSNRQAAVLVLNDVEKLYPGAWLREVGAGEIKAASNKALVVPVSKIPSSKRTTTTKKQTQAGNTSSLTDKQLDSLMQRAKNDFKKQDYSQAIRYLTAIIAAGDHKYSGEALELLGLSRQRKGQNAHAAAIYKEYLEKYPTGEGAIRVQQRLSGLLTSTQAPREKIHVEDEKEEKGIMTTYGSFSQYYRKDIAEVDGIDGSITNLSQLITFLDLTTTYQTANFDQNFRFSADDTYDFLDEDEKNSFRFIEAFYDLSSSKSGTSGRFGRQALRIGGILKRFDGISAGYQFTPNMRLNALAGYPVDIDNKTSINQHKSFYGFIFETGTFLQNWDMNLFFFDQDIDGLDDRTSTGTEVRYNDRTRSIFGMIDYDLNFNEINILQLNANLLFDRGRTAYMNAFLRKAPVLATSNALIGQTASSIEELQQTLSIEQIYQLARDRTADSATITVGGSQPISEKFQANADITFSKVDGTEASGGVPATPSTGTDYFISAQIVGNNLILRRDTGVLGIRYLDTEQSDTWAFIANTRFPISRDWRINPRLQYDIRTSSDGRTQNKLRALLRTDYRYLNKVRFDFEIGFDDTSEDINGQSLGNSNLFFMLGYRWDF